MIKCREFENQLWANPRPFKDRNNLTETMAAHLERCADCQNVYARFIESFELADNSALVKDDKYWQEFETKVWQKIETPAKLSTSVNTVLTGKRRIGLAKLSASFGGAIALVILIVIAISNLGEKYSQLIPINKSNQLADMETSQNSIQLKTYNVTLNPVTDSTLHIDDFSLLPEPQINIIDTSILVAIDAAYLTNEGLDKENVPIIKAMSKEIITGKGRIDNSIEAFAPEYEMGADSNWVITVEKMPRMIKTVLPSYPPIAHRLKKGGEVWVKAFVDTQGNVERAFIRESSGSYLGFEEAALEAAYQNKFEPFEMNGRQIPIWVIYKVRFVCK